ncbi:alpha/beta hydrolase family protein [Desulfolutivibrio sp.]|uniref:alpha/beta hydrolase family protein n=1 Tax=Desulfolutivibrio sp. TaxID=2773296 RepID=UPI002F96E805
MAVFVCVHGAFQGGWVWSKTAAALREAGHVVFTPTLTGMGERVHVRGRHMGLETYVQDVENVILYEQLSDVLLVSHSYSGMITPAVCERVPGRVRRLVFLDAVLPEPGLSFAEIAGPEFVRVLSAHCNGAEVRPWPMPMFGLPEGEKSRPFAERLVPIPSAAFRDASTAPRESAWPAPYFIRCAKTKNPLLARMAAHARERGFGYAEISSDHNPMTTDPLRLAKALCEAAGD